MLLRSWFAKIFGELILLELFPIQVNNIPIIGSRCIIFSDNIINVDCSAIIYIGSCNHYCGSTSTLHTSLLDSKTIRSL